MSFIGWFNPNVIDMGGVNDLGYEPDAALARIRIDGATPLVLIKSAFYKTYMSGKEKLHGQGNTQAGSATFFGLPSGDLNPRHVAKEVTGMSTGNQTFSPSKNLAKSIPNFVGSLFGIILQTALNTLKLVTEFVPLAIKLLLNKGIYELKTMDTGVFVSPFPIQTSTASDTSNNAAPASAPHWDNFRFVGKWIAKVSGIVFLAPFYAVFKVLHLVGRAITSPIMSMKAAYDSGMDLGEYTWLGRFFGGVAALLSLAVTALAYTALILVAIALLTPVLFPLLTGAATAVLSPAAIAWLSGVIASVSTALVSIGTPIIAAISSVLSAGGIAVSVTALGAAVTGAALVLLGTTLGGIVDNVGESIEDQPMPNEVMQDTHKIAYLQSSIPGSAFYKAVLAPAVIPTTTTNTTTTATTTTTGTGDDSTVVTQQQQQQQVQNA
jgi:hypothetical protein